MENWKDLENYNTMFGQKALYQALVDEFGREATVLALSQILPLEAVELQVSVLTTDKPTNV